ncbi:hypothetical protein M569_01970 [Genlisea aurea]|uniref:Auxin efflux carrier component n=1 Tax=Genlisea aurea TaxID=192259 RepID=S8CZ50_9LAMI|nr:hypothetical protein M569_01970 [Genlisea aurea]
MISPADFYHVMTAVVPLYVAMVLAYGSVKWWKIFTPDQCSGINRFVALFAVPLLSFHFIAVNDPYAMNFRFVAADTLQKVIVLGALCLWANLGRNGSIDWAITVFSLATLPNTLVMGIPLLRGMYGEFSGGLMVQIVVLQSIVWYTLLLFMFEFRAARALIAEQFPDTAAGIADIRVDSDVVSLDGRQGLETAAEVGEDGRLRVIVRRSSASRPEVFSRKSIGFSSTTPRASNLTNAEIYSVQSSRNPTPRESSFNNADIYSGGGGGRNRDEETGNAGKARFSSVSPMRKRDNGQDLHMFVWSSSASPISDVFAGGAKEGRTDDISSAKGIHSITNHHHILTQHPPHPPGGGGGGGDEIRSAETAGEEDKNGRKSMPPASVMTRLILMMVWRKLIRNPNTYSSFIGLTWSLVSFRFHVEMPAIIAKSIAILSDAGLGMAMFSLGNNPKSYKRLFMALQPKIVSCGKTVAASAMAVRFLAGPAVTAVASFAVGLRGVLLRVAIVQSALPQGIVPFVFAKEYNMHPDILSTAVIFGMLIALPITLVYYILLGI